MAVTRQAPRGDGARAAGSGPAAPGVGTLAGLAAAVFVVGTAAHSTDVGTGALGRLLAQYPVAVAVGFVLVGLLAYRPFLVPARADGEPAAPAETATPDRPGPTWWSEARRWLLRLVPVTWLVLVAAYLFAPARGGEPPSTAFSPVAAGATEVPLRALAQLASFTSPYLGHPLRGPASHLWPVATALAFCLLVPHLAARASRGRSPWTVPVALAVLGGTFRFVAVVAAPSHPDLLTWLPANLHLFAAGMALAVAATRPTGELPDRLRRAVAASAAPIVGAALAVAVLAAVALGVDVPATGLVVAEGRGLVAHGAQCVAALALAVPFVLRRAHGGAAPGDGPVGTWLGRLALPAFLWAPLALGRWVSPAVASGLPDAARHPGQSLSVALVPTVTWTLAVSLVLAALTWLLVTRPLRRVEDHPVSRFTTGLWAIVLCSFAGRLWSIGTATARNPGNGDPWFYHSQANMLADGVGFGEPIQWLTQGRFVASAIHPPLFTLWLTPASMLGARGFLTNKAMAAFAGLGVVVVAALLARRFAGPRAGLAAAALVAIYPDLWIIDGTLWPEGLYTATVGLTLLAAYRWRDAPSLGRAALVGAGVGAAVLTRGEALLLLPILCLPLAWSGRREATRWVVHAGVMGIVALGLLAPWTLRNLTHFDHPVPVSTNSEEVLYYANCPDTYQGQFIGYWSFNCQERARAERVAQGQPADPPGDESERAAAWGKLGREYASAHKARLPYVAAARISRVWDLRYAENSARAIALEGRPLEWSQRGLWIYRIVALPGLVGLWLVHRRRRGEAWPLVAMLVGITVTAVYAYGHVRFRTVGDLVLIVGAAVAVDAVLELARPHPAVAAGPDGAAGSRGPDDHGPDGRDPLDPATPAQPEPGAR
ncbi:glycosyltransferase family 39 protein [Aquihabitans sp. G128]|uniref:glycosyltransferase family 39 protein n=1 Tax=Aquihabitans sp. G128 TaxID=2849779 RepID=UPI001C222839|nr:glycosyltransferase family 39 protein [Aquihabitans sp. G128]QXC62100.1 glycosyltransferase family 39 protein [Aquihabitans sp. G128]